MIFLPILALFSLMITDLILGSNRIHSLSHLFSVLDSAYTLGGEGRAYRGSDSPTGGAY